MIDLHTHNSVRRSGVFSVENLMAHETRVPDNSHNAFSVGAHPWFLRDENIDEQLERVAQLAADKRVVAIGEAGYDRRQGGATELQRKAFEAQAALAEELSKPLVIHCVKMWDELWASKKRLNPQSAWIIHGFNGGVEQAWQLIDGGFRLSLWIKSVLNGSMDEVIREMPAEMLFAETDGFDAGIELVYERYARVRGVSADWLTERMRDNYMNLVGG